MMMGKRIDRKPTVEVPPWSSFDDHVAGIKFHIPVSGISGEVASKYLLCEAALAEMQCYLPLNEATVETDETTEFTELPEDIYSCNEFRMYEFKVRRCARSRSHDWTDCPYAHPGEKARRRDPRKYHYSGAACPDFRKGNCKKGDVCEFAHGVFECWLHPARYRTQPCKDGTACRRRVCFFAHTPEQLRVLPSSLAMDSYDGSPIRQHALDPYFPKKIIPSSPTSTLIPPPISSPADSPPVSPAGVGMRRTSRTVNEVIEALGMLHLRKVKPIPCSWGGLHAGVGLDSPVVGFRPVFSSLPCAPTGVTVSNRRWPDFEGVPGKDEPVARVESGRPLRAKMYERLSKERGMDWPEVDSAAQAAPDVGWVSELVK